MPRRPSIRGDVPPFLLDSFAPCPSRRAKRCRPAPCVRFPRFGDHYDRSEASDNGRLGSGIEHFKGSSRLVTSDWWRDDELDPERIYQDVAAGLFNLAHYDGQPAGTIKLQLEDARFWPDFSGNDSAYVHRIAVRRQFAGMGVSTRMLKWAVNHAAALGRSYLRLDCEADRQELRAIYERFGFRLHSYRDVGPYHLSRYEYVIRH